MRTSLCLLALLAGSTAWAAPTLEQQKLQLALEFCVGMTQLNARSPSATAFSVADTVAQQLPGLNFSPPRALEDLFPSESLVEHFRKVFSLEAGDVLRVAGYQQFPSPEQLPYALFNAEGDVCLVVAHPQAGEDGPGIRARLDAPDSPWTASAGNGSNVWNQPAAFGERVLLATSDDELQTLVAIEARPVASREEISIVSNAALRPCLDGILNAEPPPLSAFAPTFASLSTEADEKNPQLVRNTLRSQVAGPRGLLIYNSWKPVVYCKLVVADVHQPTDDVLAAVVATVAAIPGAQEQALKTKRQSAENADPPALHGWRVKRAGVANQVTIRVGLERENLVYVTLESRAGWRW